MPISYIVTFSSPLEGVREVEREFDSYPAAFEHYEQLRRNLEPLGHYSIELTDENGDTIQQQFA